MRPFLMAVLSSGLLACTREEPPAVPPSPREQPRPAAVAAHEHEHEEHEAHAVRPAPAEAHPAEEGPWFPPSREQAAQLNPLKGSAKAVSAGKALYARECARCHGAEGRGDGPGAAALGTMLADLNGEAVSRNSDGTLQWRIASGRGGMPAFAERLSENERWQVVAYLRSRIPVPVAAEETPVVKK